MKNKKAILSTVLLLVLGLASSNAQESINASGGDVSGNGGSVSYSVGQVVYTANTGTTGSVAPGVQQPYEIYSVGIEEPGEQISLTVYPNPVKDFLILKVEAWTREKFSYRLYGISGKLFENKETEGSETRIDMSKLINGTYILKVTSNSKEVKTFKIIKN